MTTLNAAEKSTERLQKAPRPGAAVGLTLLCPGLGHVYSGFVTRGMLAYLIMLIVPWGYSLLALPFLPSQPLFDSLVLLLPLALYVATAWDAYRLAGLRGIGRRPSGFVCLIGLLALLGVCALVPGQQLFSRYWPFGHSYAIPSGSMIPTLQVGDYILTDARNLPRQRGDIVVFHPPQAYKGEHQELIKRIVGVAGDRVEIHSGRLLLNGSAQVEKYVVEPMRDDMESLTVPAGQCFMLGDNRNDSFDSRYWGCLPQENIRGKVVRVMYSRDWKRIGTKF